MEKETLISVLGGILGLVFWICFFAFPEGTMEIVSNIGNIMFVILIIAGIIGFVVLVYKKINQADSNKVFSSTSIRGQKLTHYLEDRLESAGIQNNPMQSDPLLSPMGFMSAMSEEKKRLESSSYQIARDFNVTENTVITSINLAYNRIHNKYMEQP